MFKKESPMRGIRKEKGLPVSHLMLPPAPWSQGMEPFMTSTETNRPMVCCATEKMSLMRCTIVTRVFGKRWEPAWNSHISSFLHSYIPQLLLFLENQLRKTWKLEGRWNGELFLIHFDTFCVSQKIRGPWNPWCYFLEQNATIPRFWGPWSRPLSFT